MMILQVVKIYPETIGVLREAGLQCFNCQMSPFETLEEGALGHGWTPEAVADLVDRLNEYVEAGEQSNGVTRETR